MKDSPLDSGKTAWGVVDNDFTSWYGLDDWDDGAAYPDNGGVRITFDARYHIGSLSLSPSRTGAPTAMCACSPAGGRP